jgi:hypothetical protein
MADELDDLVAEVLSRGCRVARVEDPTALRFIEQVTALKQQGKNPNLERSSEILLEQWGIDISRRALSEHTRGKCSCQKKKK